MKLNKLFLGLLCMSALTFTACSDDDDYTPATISGSQVFFAKDVPSQFEISPDATSFNVPISRYDDSGALTVTLTSEVPAGSIYSIPASVSFDAGQKETVIPVTYNPEGIEYGRYDTLSIKIDEVAATPYGISTLTFRAGVTDWGPWQNWNSAGTCTYTYVNYFGGDDTGLAFTYRQNQIKPNLFQFRIGEEPYEDEDGDLVGGWANTGDGGIILTLNYDENTGFVTCPQTYVLENSNYGSVYVADSYYYWYDVRGTDISKMSDDDYGRFDKENGIIEIPMAWYVSAGTFGYNIETITIDGYTRADLTASVAYVGKFIDARDNYFVVANAQLGADIEKAHLALVAGEPTDDNIAAIAAGTYEPLVEVTASGDVRFDANELEDGNYTFVLVPFYDGEALEAQTDGFTYATAGKETWNLVATGDFTYEIFFTDEDEEGNEIPYVDAGLELYQSQDDAKRFKITHWGYDVDFIFTWDQTTGAVNVPQNFTGFTHPTYGDVYVLEAADYNPDRYGQYASEYDADEGTFYFCVAYAVSAGSFGVGYESFKVNWGGASSARSALVRSLEKEQKVRQHLMFQPYNRYSNHSKQLKANLTLKTIKK